MTHASLFSGIGGFDLAAEWAGWENVFHCEWNPFGQRVLKHHFPNSISYHDIKKTDFTIHANQIDILTGGFPCQPYSSAGKRLGKADERHLFPEMLRCIKEVKPRWIIGENVRGLVSWGGGLVFHEVCDDLESEGYEVQTFLIPAASVNAPHQRQRIWFVAYAHDKGSPSRFGQVQGENGKISEWDNNAEFSNTSNFGNVTNTISEYERAKQYGGLRQENGANERERTQAFFTKPFTNGFEGNVADSDSNRFQGSVQRECDDKQGWNRQITNAEKCLHSHESRIQTRGWDNFPTQPPICGGDDGISRELDGITFSKWRNESIKAYGNAIVPQVAYQIFNAINEFENGLKA